MIVADVMTRKVIAVAPDDSVAVALGRMLDNGVSGLPVIDASGALVGIVTEGDFLRRAETGTERRRPHWLEVLLGPGRLADEYVHTHARKVSAVMSTDVAAVAEDTPLDEVVRLMEARRIKRLPVLRAGRVVGIVSRANLLRAVASLAGAAPPTAAGDVAIRNRIIAELDRQPWSPRASIDVVVRDGVVELWGAVLDERERGAVRVLAENVPGVRTIKDHLIWVEPVSGFVVESPEDAGAATR